MGKDFPTGKTPWEMIPIPWRALRGEGNVDFLGRKVRKEWFLILVEVIVDSLGKK